MVFCLSCLFVLFIIIIVLLGGEGVSEVVCVCTCKKINSQKTNPQKCIARCNNNLSGWLKNAKYKISYL